MSASGGGRGGAINNDYEGTGPSHCHGSARRHLRHHTSRQWPRRARSSNTPRTSRQRASPPRHLRSRGRQLASPTRLDSLLIARAAANRAELGGDSGRSPTRYSISSGSLTRCLQEASYRARPAHNATPSRRTSDSALAPPLIHPSRSSSAREHVGMRDSARSSPPPNANASKKTRSDTHGNACPQPWARVRCARAASAVTAFT